MIDKKLFINPMEEQIFDNMMDTVTFEKEIMYYYKNFTEKMKKPDLLGKTVKITSKQYSEIYYIIQSIANTLNIEIPDTYVYEDFYYGVESKGSDKPWIEISAKTISDFKKEELIFLIAKEMCAIYLKHTYYSTMVNEILNAIQNNLHIPGSQTLYKYWKIIMYKWSRAANYTTDNFGYLYCGDISNSVSSIKKIILNNCKLADELNLEQYMKQTDEINMLNDDVYNYTKLDEVIPYGPFRIKNLISYSSSYRGINALKELGRD